MKLSEILRVLEKEVPPALQESYDNCGLLVGDRNSDINAALVCVEVTEEILDEALGKGCNLIISHHPLIFTGMKSLTGHTLTERIVMRAIRNEVAIYAMHTNLDNHAAGVNRILCEKLRLNDIRILKPAASLLRKLVTFCPHEHAHRVREALFDAGAGVIGKYDSCSYNSAGDGTFRGSQDSNPFVGKAGQLHIEPETRIETIFPAYRQQKILSALLQAHPYEEVAYDIYPLENLHPEVGAGMIGMLDKETAADEFLRKVKVITATGCIRHTSLAGRKVRKVAVCGGSGSFLIKEAMASGADIFITADLKYHDFFITEDRMILADAGHFETEQFSKELIANLLNKNFTTFAILFPEHCSNPVNYL